MGILFFVIWIIFNGRVTVEIVLFGLFLTVLLYAFVYRVFHFRMSRELWFWKRFFWILVYAANLAVEIVKAAFAVAKVIFSRRGEEAVFVEFHSGFSDRVRNVLLANSITLTPGTYTVALEDDRFLVACLRPEFAEGMEDSSFVRILRRMGK